MSPKIHAHAAAILAVNLVVTVAVSRPALAGDASAWDGDQRAAVRLIAGAQRGTVRRAGIEIRLAPGWKTYWRYPGDSGIPPRFDFSQSKNVKSVTVRYPAPHRLTDEKGAEVAMSPLEFDLLKALAEHPNRALSRERILNLKQQGDWDPFDRSVDLRIMRLRKKVEPDPEHPRFIRTIRNEGYIFVPDGE